MKLKFYPKFIKLPCLTKKIASIMKKKNLIFRKLDFIRLNIYFLI